MGCFNSKLRPHRRADNPRDTQEEAKSSSRLTSVAIPQQVTEDLFLQGVKLYGVGAVGEAALFSRLVIARGHVLAAVFEGHISPSAAEYCRSNCWDAFVQANASWQQTPAAAALRALDRGFLTSSKHSLESRLSSGCSATLVHIDLTTRTVTVATVGAHGAVGLGIAGSGDGAPDGAVGRAATAKKSGSGAAAATEADASRRGQLCEGVGGGGGEGQRGATGPAGGLRPLGRFVTLEAPSLEGRQGLSGLVDIVQSALSHPAAEPSAAAAPGPSAAPGSMGTAAAPPPAAPKPPHQCPEGLPSAALPNTDLRAPGSGAPALTRRGSGSMAATGSSGAAAPQVLGFGCAKDATMVSAFESAAAAAATAAAAAGSQGASSAPAAAAPHAHTHVQPPATGANPARFAALSRLHCSCDVRVTSRPLLPNDECIALLAGCGGTGGRVLGGPKGAGLAGPSSGPGSAAGSVVSGSAAAGLSSGGGVESGGVAVVGRNMLGGASKATSSSQVAASAQLSPLPSGWGPAGALSTADAVSLAHELAVAAAATTGFGAPAAQLSAAAGPRSAGRDNRFEVLYDSYDTEAVIAAAAAVAAAAGEPRAAAAPAHPAAGSCAVGDRSAGAVASYAVAAALRNRGLDGASRREGGASTSTALPALSAACIVLWLDWTAGSSAKPAAPPPPPSMHRSTSTTAPRWEMLRGYCSFRVARRRRIFATWRGLVAAVRGPTAAGPLHSGTTGSGGVAGLPSWVPVQLASPLGRVSGAAAGGAPQGSVESCSGLGAGLGGAVGRTASFTSRPPVMMEFVEELPTPSPSVTVAVGRGTHPDMTLSVGGGVGGGAGGGGGEGGDDFSTSVAGSCTANAAAATMDESYSHSASAAAPYGISGLVVEPMGSTEEAVPEDPVGGTAVAAAGTGSTGAAAASPTPSAGAPGARSQLSQRSFVMPYGSALVHSARALLGMRSSHSTPEFERLMAASAGARSRGSSQHPDGSGPSGSATSADPAGGRAGEQAAEVQESETIEFTRGSAFCSSQMAASTPLAGAAASSATAVGAGGGTDSGSPFDWSLIMASVHNNSVTRDTNSAGHTPIPSTAANRLPPIAGYSPESGTYHGAPAGAGGDLGGNSGGYLPISGSGSFRLRQSASVPAAVAAAQSAISSGMGMSYLPTASSGTAAEAGPSRGDGRYSLSPEIQPPPGILVGRRSAGDSADGDSNADNLDNEAELISEDLPQLRIESTAELAALMAEIIITDDGEVVRTGGGGMPAGPPPPYTSRSHVIHHGLHHKGSRALSRQGSRGWQPRLAIVREDAREANTTTSCSQVLLGDGIHFTAISEERSSSQNSSNSNGAGEHSQVSGSSSNNSHQSRLANSSNGTASNGSPNASVEEQLHALDAAGAAAILVPPTVPRTQPPTAAAAAAAATAATAATAVDIAGGGGDAVDAAGGNSTPVVAQSEAAASRGAFPLEHLAAIARMPYGTSGALGTPGRVCAVAPSPFERTFEQMSPQHPPQDLVLRPQLQRLRSPAAGAASAGAAGAVAAGGGDSPTTAFAPASGVAALSPAAGPADWNVPAAASPSYVRNSGAVAEAQSAAAGSADNALAAALGSPVQPVPFGAASPSLQSRPRAAAGLDATAGNRATSPLALAAGAALETVLEDLRPSLDRYRLAEDGTAAGAVHATAANNRAAAVGGAGAGGGPQEGPGFGGDGGTGAGVLASTGSLSMSRRLSSANLQEDAGAEAAVAAAAVAAATVEALRAGCADMETPLHHPALAVVGRSRSASVSRGAARSQHLHLRHLLHQCSLPAHHAQHEHGALQQYGAGSGGAGSDAGSGSDFQQPLTPVSEPPTSRQQHHHPNLHHHHRQAVAVAAAAAVTVAGGTVPYTRHLYGLAEASAPPRAASDCARSCSSAAAAAPSSALHPPQSLCDTGGGAGGVGNTATTLDRTWSVGSTSGPLYSLLHSTLSKGSVTAATSTAVATPGCNSAQCSGGRLPSVNSMAGSAANPPPPSQASTPAAAVTAGALAGHARAAQGPGSASRQELSGLGSAGRRQGGGGGAAAAVSAVPPPSLNAAAECPSSALTDDSSPLSITLHAERYSNWETHAGTSLVSVSGGCSMGAVAAAAGASTSVNVNANACAGTGDGSAASLAGTDPAGRSLPVLVPHGLQQGPHQQHTHTLRMGALPPTRLSKTGIAKGSEPTFNFFNTAAVADTQGYTVGPSQEISTASAAVAAAAVAAAASVGVAVAARSNSYTGFTPAAAVAAAAAAATGNSLAPSSSFSRTLGGSATTAYGVYGTPGAAAAAGMPEAVLLYDEGGPTNRSSNILRSDASVWNSTSAWTASTGRTTDTSRTDMMVVGGSNRRMVGMGGGVAGGSSAMILQGGIAVGGGGGGGAGDTSGFLGYNATYSSVSGLLMTADAGAPSSNTQLLMQMGGPSPGTFGGGGGGAVGAVGGGGGGGSNAQHSSQLFCSPRQGQAFLGSVVSGVTTSASDNLVPPAQMLVMLAAQSRANPAVYGMHGDAHQHQHHQHPYHQFLLQQTASAGEPRGPADRPVGHLADPPPVAGLALAQQIGSAHTGAKQHPQMRRQTHQVQLSPPQHQQQQQQLLAASHPRDPRQDLYRSNHAVYDSNSHAPLFHETVLDSTSGCFLLAGGSTSNNAANL